MVVQEKVKAKGGDIFGAEYDKKKTWWSSTR